MRFTTDTFNTGSISASSSGTFNRTLSGNIVNIGKIKVVPSGSTVGYQLEIYKKDTFLAADRQYRTKSQFTGNFYDPTDRAGAEVLEGFVIPYEDLDATKELHIKVLNSDAVARSYDVTVLYENRSVFTEDTLNITTPKTPATAGAAGAVGDIAWDSSYLYICIATNTWRRIAHATW